MNTHMRKVYIGKWQQPAQLCSQIFRKNGENLRIFSSTKFYLQNPITVKYTYHENFRVYGTDIMVYSCTFENNVKPFM